jgi:sodium-dependent dicarboxylate transporter 2/3/5
MFFPNVIVMLSLIPIVKFILERIDDEEVRKKISTPLALALIYGANIGGMASLIGSPLNLVYVSYLEICRVPGREHITFFSWLLFGVPATLVLIFISRWLLKRGEIDSPLPLSCLENDIPGAVEAGAIKKYLWFFGLNIFLIIFMTAVQFFFKPGKVAAGLSIIDVILLVYLVVFLFFSFIFPRSAGSGKRALVKYQQNFLFLLLFVVFFPWVYILETLKEVRSRLKLKTGEFIRRFDDRLNRAFHRIWGAFFKEPLGDLRGRREEAFVSINRLIYDLPFMGLLFMGVVIVLIFFLLKLGDDPGTPNLDGYLVRFFEGFTAEVMPQDNQSFFFLMGISFISIFITEFINNTTVVLIMLPLVLKMAAAAHLNPLFYLLAVSTAASAAFMTPIATPVNAVGYAAIEGVSLRDMVKRGFILNIISALWLTCFFYFLNLWV